MTQTLCIQNNIGDMMPWIVALIIGTSSAIINIYIVKKQINTSTLSGNRQKWINELRDLVSQYLALSGTFSFINRDIINRKIEYNEALDERSQEIRKIKSKIELLLNPLETDSIELLDKIAKLRLCAQKDVSDGAYLIEYRECHDEIIKTTQKILKKEWIRVKKGV